MKNLLLLISMLLIHLPHQLAAGYESWPEVQSLAQTFRIPDVSVTNADTPATASILDLKGRPIYKLECHNGNYSDQSRMNFSGTFQCALFAMKGGSSYGWNLLADRNQQDSDWGNRGRMLSEQLRGSCAGWPGYGSVRVFRLRGMKITFTFKDLKWKPVQHEERLATFTFEVNVVRDPTAKTAEAEILKVPKAPRSCMW